MATLDKITQVPIHLVNWGLVGLTLLAAPQIAGVKFGGLQVVSTQDAQLVAMGGFSGAFVLNLVGALWLFAKRAKLRRLCLQWCAIHALFLVVLVLIFYRYIDFEWLKEWLTSLR